MQKRKRSSYFEKKMDEQGPFWNDELHDAGVKLFSDFERFTFKDGWPGTVGSGLKRFELHWKRKAYLATLILRKKPLQKTSGWRNMLWMWDLYQLFPLQSRCRPPLEGFHLHSFHYFSSRPGTCLWMLCCSCWGCIFGKFVFCFFFMPTIWA